MIQNYEIFKEKIFSDINDSQLDIGAIYFIFKDIYSEVEKLYDGQINYELLNMQKEAEMKVEE